MGRDGGREGRDASERDISGEVADKWSKRGIVGDKKNGRRGRGRDVHSQRRHGNGKGMSHLSELTSLVFTSHVFTSGIS